MSFCSVHCKNGILRYTKLIGAVALIDPFCPPILFFLKKGKKRIAARYLDDGSQATSYEYVTSCRGGQRCPPLPHYDFAADFRQIVFAYCRANRVVRPYNSIVNFPNSIRRGFQVRFSEPNCDPAERLWFGKEQQSRRRMTPGLLRLSKNDEMQFRDRVAGKE